MIVIGLQVFGEIIPLSVFFWKDLTMLKYEAKNGLTAI